MECSYDVLREMALGHVTRPNIDVLLALVRHARGIEVAGGPAQGVLTSLDGWLR